MSNKKASLMEKLNTNWEPNPFKENDVVRPKKMAGHQRKLNERFCPSTSEQNIVRNTVQINYNQKPGHSKKIHIDNIKIPPK